MLNFLGDECVRLAEEEEEQKDECPWLSTVFQSHSIYDGRKAWLPLRELKSSVRTSILG